MIRIKNIQQIGGAVETKISILRQELLLGDIHSFLLSKGFIAELRAEGE